MSIANYAILAGVAAAVIGLVAGTASVTGAYRERAEYKAKLDGAAATTALAETDRDEARNDAAAKIAVMVADARFNDELAKIAALRNIRIHKELSNAKQSLVEWRAKAGNALDACLRTELPAGLLPVRAPSASAADPVRTPAR